MNLHYLEIVTPEVDAVCAAYAQLHRVEFSQPEAALGGARTAQLRDGVRIGIRAPMHASEQPVVRPYTLVEDIEKAVVTATDAGAQLALPPLDLPGHGKCAILFQGGIQLGLWQDAEGST